MPVPLNYQGRPGMEDMSAFNARTNITWKGDMLFRVYPHEGKLYFIKVGGSKNNQAAIHFGLIGWLINHFAQKRAAKKTQETLGAIAGLTPDQLLGRDKVNHVIDVRQVSEPALNPKSFWGSAPFGTFTFRNEKGKKKTFSFDDGPNFGAASRALVEAMGDKLTVKARWDDMAGKVVKVESARL